MGVQFGRDARLAPCGRCAESVAVAGVVVIRSSGVGPHRTSNAGTECYIGIERGRAIEPLVDTKPGRRWHERAPSMTSVSNRHVMSHHLRHAPSAEGGAVGGGGARPAGTLDERHGVSDGRRAFVVASNRIDCFTPTIVGGRGESGGYPSGRR